MNRRLLSHVIPYLLILPAVLLASLFIYGVMNGVLQGFGIIPYLGLTTPTLEYYRTAFTRSDLSMSILYTFYLALTSSVLATLGGVALSAAITRAGMGRKGQLLGVQIPLMVSHAIVALFIISLFSGSGLVARLLYTGGLIGSMQDFPTVLGATSGWGIILVYLWKEIPFVAFLHGNAHVSHGRPLCGSLCLPWCKSDPYLLLDNAPSVQEDHRESLPDRVRVRIRRLRSAVPPWRDASKSAPGSCICRIPET